MSGDATGAGYVPGYGGINPGLGLDARVQPGFRTVKLAQSPKKVSVHGFTEDMTRQDP